MYTRLTYLAEVEKAALHRCLRKYFVERVPECLFVIKHAESWLKLRSNYFHKVFQKQIIGDFGPLLHERPSDWNSL